MVLNYKGIYCVYVMIGSRQITGIGEVLDIRRVTREVRNYQQVVNTRIESQTIRIITQ